MKQEELQSIVSELVEELRELPDQTELSTRQLMDRAGYMDEELSNEDLMDIDYALRQAARKAHIILDSSKHDGIPEGLYHPRWLQARRPGRGPALQFGLYRQERKGADSMPALRQYGYRQDSVRIARHG